MECERYRRTHGKIKGKCRIKIETNQLTPYRRSPISLEANVAAAKAKAEPVDAGGPADDARFAVSVLTNP
jgi:hypothetical protein